MENTNLLEKIITRLKKFILDTKSLSAENQIPNLVEHLNKNRKRRI